jgi:hypothetical protein
MAAVPDIASVGEVHHLIDHPQQWVCGGCYSKHAEEPPELSEKRPAWQMPQRAEITCPVLTPVFRRERFADASLYARVAAQFNASTIVSSDKSPDIYRRFVHSGTMDGLFLFRHPAGYVASDRRRGRNAEASLRIWHGFVQTVHRWCRSYCKSVHYVCYENLVADPERGVQALCAALGLHCPSTLPSLNDIEYHHVGGNARAHFKREVQRPELADVTDDAALDQYRRWRVRSVV